MGQRAVSSRPTISSLQMGQTKADPFAADRLDCAPRLMLDPMSCPRSVRVAEPGGEIEEDPRETVLSEGARGLSERGAPDGGVGGARPLPLPKMRPPPSLRPDISLRSGSTKGRGKLEEHQHQCCGSGGEAGGS
jgi:hypothetical protein